MSVNLGTIERVMANDKKGIFTLITMLSAIGMLFNSFTVSSLVLGALFSSVYFLVNSVFLGHLLFKEEGSSSRTAFGFLILIMLVILGNAAAMLLSGLEIFSLKFDEKVIAVVLVLITGVISATNHFRSRRVKPQRSSQAPEARK